MLVDLIISKAWISLLFGAYLYSFNIISLQKGDLHNFICLNFK